MHTLHSLQVPEGRFPTSKRDYELVTPMMEDFLSIVSLEIERMSTGIAIYGPSRIGKSRAIEYVLSNVRIKYPTVTCVDAVMVDRKTRSDARFFKGLAADAKLGIPLVGDGDDLRTSIIRHLLARCSDTHDPRVLFLLDEAQRMKPYEFSYLIDLTNQLEKYGMSATVILIGQAELLESRSELIRLRRMDVIGRFLENPLAFNAVSNFQDLKTVLCQYDDPSCMQFPRDSKTCITAAYLPKLYKNGFRISNSANPFWNSIIKAASQLRVPPVIGMRSLTIAVESALTSINLSDSSDVTGFEEWWKTILQDSGYLKNLVIISSPADDRH